MGNKDKILNTYFQTFTRRSFPPETIRLGSIISVGLTIDSVRLAGAHEIALQP